MSLGEYAPLSERKRPCVPRPALFALFGALLWAVVGLTATGKPVTDMHASFNITHQPDGTVEADLTPIEKFKGRKVSEEELRGLCIDFQTDVVV